MAEPQHDTAHELTATPPFRTITLDLTLYHGTAYAITTLEPSEAGLLENAPPATYLTPDLDTAKAYARRTASHLARITGQKYPELVYSVQLSEPTTADCRSLINLHSIFEPAYRSARTGGPIQNWVNCLSKLENAVQLAALDHGAAIILTPAGPDGETTAIPEYLSFQPVRNTSIVSFALVDTPFTHWHPHHNLNSILTRATPRSTDSTI